MVKKELIKKVTKYVEDNIGAFHQTRIDKVMGMTLREIISAKNPYLFKAKNMLTAQGIIDSILSATISSSEETTFGNWLEGLAVFVADTVYGGMKSLADGIDLEIIKDGIRYVMVIKSGKVWGNKSQVRQMKDNFIEAQRRLKTSGHREAVEFVNGICYGKANKNIKTPKGGPDYHFLCGQEFWSFISGDDNLYIEIIEPLGHKAKEKNDTFNEEYSALSNRLTGEFLTEYCDNGVIQWVKLVKANSEKVIPKVKKVAVKKAKVGKL